MAQLCRILKRQMSQRHTIRAETGSELPSISSIQGAKRVELDLIRVGEPVGTLLHSELPPEASG